MEDEQQSSDKKDLMETENDMISCLHCDKMYISFESCTNHEMVCDSRNKTFAWHTLFLPSVIQEVKEQIDESVDRRI